MQLTIPVEFVVLDDFDLVFFIDDVGRNRRKRQFQTFRVLSHDSEKWYGGLNFDEAVAFEERDAAPRPREPVAERAHQRSDAFLGRQPLQRRVDGEPHCVILARFQTKTRPVVGLPRIGIHPRRTDAIVDGTAGVDHPHVNLFGNGLPSSPEQEHRERHVAFQHRRIQRDLHCPIVEPVEGVGDKFLVDVEILVVVDDDRGALVDVPQAKPRGNQVKRVRTLFLAIGDVGRTLDQALELSASDVVRVRFGGVVFSPFQMGVLPKTAGAGGGAIGRRRRRGVKRRQENKTRNSAR